MSRLMLRATLAVACLLASHGRAWSNEECVDGNCPPARLGHHQHHFGHDGYHGFQLGPANYGRVGGSGHVPHYGGGNGYLGYAGYPAQNYEVDFRNFNAYAGPAGCRTCSAGDCQYRWYGRPDLFYNYYVPPTCGGVGAELYISPRPVPPHVGHTFITYQPLMPHEMLYHHKRTYHRYYNSGQGLTRTSVKWCR